MSWRLHLTNDAIQNLDILPGTPPLLAAWSRPDRVVFYDLTTGIQQAESALLPPAIESRQEAAWENFVAELVAPNGAYLPVVRTPHATIYTTDDGRMRLYHTGSTDIFLDNEGQEVQLEVKDANAFRAITLDRFLGLSAMLDDDAHMHIYQQHIRVGRFDLSMNARQDLRMSIAISRGGGMIFVSDGSSLLLTDSSGSIRKRLDTHYYVGALACSPNGRIVVTGDTDTGVLRVYDGSDLTPLRQRFAIDLVAEATQLQLLADLPSLLVALSALAVNDAGTLAFAMSGVICVTDITQMDSLPRPQSLF